MGTRPAEPWESPLPDQARTHQGQRAGIVTRTVAAGVDVVVLAVVLVAIYAGAAGVKFTLDPVAFRFPAPPRGVLLGTSLGVAVVYFAVCWAVTGRTVGDQLLGLRVFDRRARRLRWYTALARAAACVFVPAGLLWAVGPKHKSLQDIVLRTSVVYDWERQAQPGSPERREAREPAPRHRDGVSEPGEGGPR